MLAIRAYTQVGHPMLFRFPSDASGGLHDVTDDVINSTILTDRTRPVRPSLLLRGSVFNKYPLPSYSYQDVSSISAHSDGKDPLVNYRQRHMVAYSQISFSL